jgi:hypothetical protein
VHASWNPRLIDWDIFGSIPHHLRLNQQRLPVHQLSLRRTRIPTSSQTFDILRDIYPISPPPTKTAQFAHYTTMSDDTRETVDINALPPKPRAPANTMPGGTAHTAGGEKTSDGGPSYIDAVRSLGPEYYMNCHKRPCVRDSQLQGLAAGFAGGSLAAIIGSTSIPQPASDSCPSGHTC